MWLDSAGQPPGNGAQPGRSRRVPTLIAAGFALLLLAWTFATVPFSAPDEASHYLRALTLANGHILGPKVPYHNPGLSPEQLAFASSHTRAVQVPAALTPPDVSCETGAPDTHGCSEATSTGDYLPTAYIVPAMALAVAGDSSTALWLSRLGSAVLCALLIALAVALLWNGDGWSLLGLMVAVSPMVLFVGSVLSPSGLNAAAALAFVASLVRVSRDPDRTPPWVWGAAAAAGGLVVLSWQLGPAFVVIDVVAIAGLTRPRWRAFAIPSRRRVGWVAVALLGCLLLWGGYAAVSGTNHADFGIRPIGASLRAGIDQLGPVLRDWVGTFGSLSVHLPTGVYWLWWLLVGVLAGAAVLLGRPAERLTVLVTVVVVLLFPVLFYAWIYRFTGFGMQGRYVLPLLMLIPLVSGEIVGRHRGRFDPRGRLPVLVGAGVAAFQLYAFWLNARANAGSSGAIRFFSAGVWSPPLGWTPWLLIALLGAGAIAGAVPVGSRRRA